MKLQVYLFLEPPNFHGRATDLFAFQGSQTRVTAKPHLPDVIKSWPILTLDSSYISIGRAPQGRNEALSEAEEFNANSILVVADDAGSLHYFLDGTFPLGPVYLGFDLSVSTLLKKPMRPGFIAHPYVSVDERFGTSARPFVIALPLLTSRKPRDLAMLSSTSRELLWYIMRSVKEMRAMWFGSDTTSGAREIGPKWIRSLEEKQKEQYGRGFMCIAL